MLLPAYDLQLHIHCVLASNIATQCRESKLSRTQERHYPRLIISGVFAVDIHVRLPRLVYDRAYTGKESQFSSTCRGVANRSHISLDFVVADHVPAADVLATRVVLFVGPLGACRSNV